MEALLSSPNTLARQNQQNNSNVVLPTHALLRSSSNLGSSNLDNSSNEDRSGSECSDCIPSSASSTPSMRRIALAKQILDEATSSFTPSLSISAAKTDKCKNTGALGPLLIMMQNEQDTEKLRGCLDTLAFLLLDKANRKVINEIHGLDVIMGLFSRTQDPTVLCSALDAVCSLVRSDDADKVCVWSHPGKAGVLGMLSNPGLGSAHLCEVLCMIRKIAFTSASNGKEPELLEPGLLPTLASMLQTTLPRPALLRVLKVLKLCTGMCGPQHLPSWNLAVFNLVPLLKDNMVSEEVLHILLQLSERPEFKNVFMAAGTIPPLLALLVNSDKSIPIAAVCVLSSLSDGGLSCEQLLQEPSLLALLRALQLNQHVEVSIGVLYTLNRLACGRPHVANFLRQRGAAQVLRRLLQDWTDEDLRLGASQLLGTIGSAAVAPSSKPSLATDGDGGGGGGGGGGGANGNEGSSIASLETGAAAAAANGGGSMDGVAAQQQQQQQQQQQRLATLNAQLQDGMELLSSVVASKGLASFADPRGCSIPDAPKVIRNIAC